MLNSPDISVVLPVYNEAEHIDQELRRIYKTLSDSRYTFEIIVVDDGSSDGSASAAAAFGAARVIRFESNRGSGFARRCGTMAAQGDVVVWTDVDMSYPNDRIAELVDELVGYDQVVGVRTSEEGTFKVFRRPAKWLIRRLASYLSRTQIPDLNSGFRAFRRSVADQFLYLLPTGFSCVTTITMAFLGNNYSVKYVPIEYSPRAGESKFHWRRDTQRYVLQVVRMILMHEPIRFFGPLAAVLGTVGVAKLVFDLVDKDFRVAANTIVLLSVSVALAVVGLLADLVVQLNKRRHDVFPAHRNEF